MSEPLAAAWRKPEECHERVIRKDGFDACEKPSVAMRYDPEDGEPYPVCARHCRADMVPLSDLVDANAMHVAASYFRQEISRAWGGDRTWYTTGTHVAELVADVLDELANESGEARADA